MSGPESIRLRCARHEDARDAWRWRNDPATRAASHQAEPIAWETHELWWKGSLGRADRVLMVGEDAAGVAAGLVRFDARPDGAWLVGIHVAPERRGQGWGRALLAAGLERMRRKRSAARFVAEIKPENAASQRLFAACGFRPGPGLGWTLQAAADEAAA